MLLFDEMPVRTLADAPAEFPDLSRARTFEEEEWRAVPDWSEYEVSSHGRVRRVGCAHGATVGRVLKPWISVGYPFIALWRGNLETRVPVHRLVALAFLPSPAVGQYQVAHQNGVRTDNRPSNLRWATPTENASDRDAHGTGAKGERNPMARLTPESVIEIRVAATVGETQESIAKQFGVCRQTVSDIVNRRRWGHIQ